MATSSPTPAGSPPSRGAAPSPNICPDRTMPVPTPTGDAKPEDISPKTVLVREQSSSLGSNTVGEVQSPIPQHQSQEHWPWQPHLGGWEYAIALPLDADTADMYQQAIYNSRRAIKSFVVHEDLKADSVLTVQMRDLIKDLDETVTHADLHTGWAAADEHVSIAVKPSWAESYSAKFQFLRAFIDQARALPLHVIIVASVGLLIDILVLFLDANRGAYVRPGTIRSSSPTAEGPLHFTSVASSDLSAIAGRADLVVAFGYSVNPHDRPIGMLRLNVLTASPVCPLVHLLVVNSAEHVERCLPSSLTRVDRLQALVSCAAHLRHKVGQMPPDIPEAHTAAEKVVPSSPLADVPISGCCLLCPDLGFRFDDPMRI